MNKFFFKLVFLFSAVVMFTSCEQVADEALEAEVTVDYSTVKINPTTGSSAQLTGYSSAAWTTTQDDTWFSLSQSEGNAGEFTITVTANSTNLTIDDIYSKITICADERRIPVTIVQVGAAVEISTSTDSVTYDSLGNLTSSTSLTVSSNAAWEAYVVDDVDWITLETVGGDVNLEGEAIEFTLSENISVGERRGQIAVGIPDNSEILVEVIQTGSPFISDIDTSAIDGVELDGAGAETVIYVTANTAWSITPTQDWITFEPSSGDSSDTATEVTIKVAANPDFSNSRQGTFTIAYEECPDQDVDYTITQAIGDQSEDAVAILALLPTLNGAGTFSPNWDLSLGATLWEGVTFDAGKLVKIELASEGLAGEIPSELGSFSELNTIDLSGNNLTGNIPVEIGSLENLTTFKVANNQLSGSVPADVVTSLYPQWDAMTNVFPQQGSDDISDPANLALKLDQYGALRVMYWTLGGPGWADSACTVTEPEWLYDEPTLTTSMFGIRGVNSAGSISSFGKTVTGVSGEMPLEMSMIGSSFAQLWLNDNNLTGELHASLVKNFKYLVINNNALDMDLNDLLSNINTAAVNIQIKNSNLVCSGGITEDIINLTKLNSSFNVSGNIGLTGTVSATVKEFLVGILGSESAFTSNVITGTSLSE